MFINFKNVHQFKNLVNFKKKTNLKKIEGKKLQQNQTGNGKKINGKA